MENLTQNFAAKRRRKPLFNSILDRPAAAHARQHNEMTGLVTFVASNSVQPLCPGGTVESSPAGTAA